MKPGILLLILVGGIGIGVGYLLGGRAQAPDPAAIQQAQTQIIQGAISPAGEGTAVHTFPDETSLQEFVGLPQTPAELAEGLEQLRALEHGYRIRAAVIEGWTSIPVDVPADIARAESTLARS